MLNYLIHLQLISIPESENKNTKLSDNCGYLLQSHAIVFLTYKERANFSILFEIKSRLGNKEVMPMIESSISMGHQVAANRLCAGAVL